MSEGIRNAHAIWLYVVLVVGGIAIGQMIRGWAKGEKWRPMDQRFASFFITALDMEIVLGILLWITQERWDGDDLLRSWRHPVLMLMAWGAARFGWYRARYTATNAESKFARAAIFFGIAGIVIVVGVLQIREVF